MAFPYTTKAQRRTACTKRMAVTTARAAAKRIEQALKKETVTR